MYNYVLGIKHRWFMLDPDETNSWGRSQVFLMKLIFFCKLSLNASKQIYKCLVLNSLRQLKTNAKRNIV